MDVNYRWSFLIDDEPCIERRKKYIPYQTYRSMAVEEEEPDVHHVISEQPMMHLEPVMYHKQ